MFSWKENELMKSPLSNPVARDLWWVFASTPLLKDTDGLPQHSEAERLGLAREVVGLANALDKLSVEEAMETVQSDGWRVGHYFEALIAFALQGAEGWTMVGTNVAVKREKETLGAFDFIVETPSGSVEHWEVAVKFYLLLGDSTEWSSWVGPNQRDRLDKKVGRMRGHQLPLSARAEGLVALENLGVTRIDRRIALLKGEFFTEWNTGESAPIGATTTARGRWIEARQTSVLHEHFSGDKWMLREKPFWLSPVESTGDMFLATLPSELKRPQMWSRLSQQANGHWAECERWFVVPDDWREGRTRARRT